jgi:predicted TIM-barrel fold metal-dependent hydrolase
MARMLELMDENNIAGVSRGSSQILFGTDYPLRAMRKRQKDTIEALAQFDSFDATFRRKIAFDNARVLFFRFAHQRW